MAGERLPCGKLVAQRLKKCGVRGSHVVRSITEGGICYSSALMVATGEQPCYLILCVKQIVAITGLSSYPHNQV